MSALVRIKRLVPDLDPARVAEVMLRNVGRLNLDEHEFSIEARKAANEIDCEEEEP